jgi:CHAT domain-containing protein
LKRRSAKRVPPAVSDTEWLVQVAHAERAARAATSDDLYAALADAAVTFGHRFGLALESLAKTAGREEQTENPYTVLTRAFQLVFASWLSGQRLTPRADERERRVEAALALAADDPIFAPLAANVLLHLPAGHPKRDLALISGLRPTGMSSLTLPETFRDLRPWQRVARSPGMILGAFIAGTPDRADEQLAQITFSIASVDLDESSLARHVRRGTVAERNARHYVIRLDFRLRSARRYFELAVEAGRQGDEDGARRLVSHMSAMLEDLAIPDAVLMLGEALSHFAQDFESLRRAAGMFAAVVESSTAARELRLTAARKEAAARRILLDFERMYQVLRPLLPAYEVDYLTALDEDELDAAGRAFGEVVLALTYACVRLNRWAEAAELFERGKCSRLRYRAQLRANYYGDTVIEREAELSAFRRGLTLAAPPVPNSEVDPLGSRVGTEAALLEANRRLRTEFPSEVLAPPSLRALTGVMYADEGVIVLIANSTSTLVAGFLAGDVTSPTVVSVGEMTDAEWLDLLAQGRRGTWLASLRTHRSSNDSNDTLERVLAAANHLIYPVARRFEAENIHRVTILPHRWFHVVPFWALPSLSSFLVETAITAADFVEARTRSVPRLPSRALVVANPAGDLRAADAEAATVEASLKRHGVASQRLAGLGATETALLNELRDGAALLHFCGHGRSDFDHPERSALFLAPDPSVLSRSGHVFPAVLPANATGDASDDASYVIDGLGRVVQKRIVGGLERTLEHGKSGTISAWYADRRCVSLAELWTAADISISRELSGVALAVLSACESGLERIGESNIDEPVGLLAAMRLAGVANTIATLWPVGDVEGALFMHEFYAALGQCEGVVDLHGLLNDVRVRFRTMSRDAALESISALRDMASDPIARFVLERFREQLPNRPAQPFAKPYAWAAFFVSGVGKLIIGDSMT